MFYIAQPELVIVILLAASNNVDTTFKKHSHKLKPLDLLLNYNYSAAAVQLNWPPIKLAVVGGSPPESPQPLLSVHTMTTVLCQTDGEAPN